MGHQIEAKSTTPAITSIFSSFFRIEVGLLVLVSLLLIWHHQYAPRAWQLVTPQKVYQYSLDMNFEPTNSSVVVGTFLPINNEHQKLYQESVSAPFMEQVQYQSENGLVSRWAGQKQAQSISYQALINLTAKNYELGTNVDIQPQLDPSLNQYLQPTEAIQVQHQEISELWQQIQPNDNNNLRDVLASIHSYTTGLEPLPFKGATDALTALRLGAASCNGKSRLFVALARMNQLPARLVGGVILNEGKKKTSHQWVEVNVNGQWIPFDPTNNHFASLPDNYLQLYLGDHNLFSHTPNINFDYRFDVQQKQLAPAIYQSMHNSASDTADQFGLMNLFSQLHLPAHTAVVFLMMPLCTLLITGLRNLLGLKSFGIFMPMLIASACALVGLGSGLLGFVLVVSIATTAHLAFNRLNLLKIPRLAAIITLVNVATIGILLAASEVSNLQLGLMSLFPVIIISFIADKLHDMMQQGEWQELWLTMLGTTVSIVMCYALLTSATLQGLFALYPELFLLVLTGQIYLGRWTGGRLTELLRFRKVLSHSEGVIGINKRNRDLVSKLNQTSLLKLAADKLKSKKVLTDYKIPVPGTIAQFDTLFDVQKLSQSLKNESAFVIKPNAGSQGNGILVIQDKQEQNFVTASGKTKTHSDLKNLICEIINGNYSQLGDSDTAYIEPLIRQHKILQDFAPYGLCDIRLVLTEGKLVSAMLRVPTKSSGGKANLHQGAIGAAIDLATGTIRHCFYKNQEITHHPDNGQPIVGVVLPFWSQIKQMSIACTQAIPLGYMGVDICLDQELGPLVLEVNGRPGLEIQNVNQCGLLKQKPQPIFSPAHSQPVVFA